MNLNPADKSLLSKYTTLAKKIIYNPERMKAFLKMLGSKEGAVTAVQTVLSAIDKLKPVPPQILPMLAVNSYMIMVDVAQEGTGQQADPGIMEEVVGMLLETAKGMSAQEQPQGQTGMLARMQEQGEPAGDPATPDNTPMHENAESAGLEQQEGAEEDPAGEQESGMLARMQRRGVPA